MTSVSSRFRLSSNSLRTDAALSEWEIARCSSHTSEHFVKTYGRRDEPTDLRALATTRSEWPRP